MKTQNKAVSRAKSVTITVTDALWLDLLERQRLMTEQVGIEMPMAAVVLGLVCFGLGEVKRQGLR